MELPSIVRFLTTACLALCPLCRALHVGVRTSGPLQPALRCSLCAFALRSSLREEPLLWTPLPRCVRGDLPIGELLRCPWMSIGAHLFSAFCDVRFNRCNTQARHGEDRVSFSDLDLTLVTNPCDEDPVVILRCGHVYAMSEMDEWLDRHRLMMTVSFSVFFFPPLGWK